MDTDTLNKIAKRAGELCDYPADRLLRYIGFKSLMLMLVKTGNAYGRADLIEAILINEFETPSEE